MNLLVFEFWYCDSVIFILLVTLGQGQNKQKGVLKGISERFSRYVKSKIKFYKLNPKCRHLPYRYELKDWVS